MFSGILLLAIASVGQPGEAAAGLPNALYAMDTYTKRPYPQNDITPAAQLDLIKELGYQGIGWTEDTPDAVAAVVKECEARGLKMHAIYYGAKVSPEKLSISGTLLPVMERLAGHGTIIWLHITGNGPEIGSLKADAPVVEALRVLADQAASRQLKIAIYPHVGDWTQQALDAVRLAKLVDRPNFGISYNLCHSLATGDEGRVMEVLEEAAPVLVTVTINGADAGVGKPDWSRLIQTLDRGTFDLVPVLRKLKAVGFKGPIGVQGYGIGGDRRENLERTMGAWRRLSAEAARP